MGKSREAKIDVPGLGVEGQWAMNALRTIVELGKTGKLQDEPFLGFILSLPDVVW